MNDSNKEQQVPFHEYLRIKIDSSDMKQLEIAEAMGFSKPNIITMFKQGKTRVPLEKVPKLAEVLGLNQKDLLRMAMTEYCPELLAVCEKVFGFDTGAAKEEEHFKISSNEQEILSAIREFSKGADPEMTSIDHKIAVGKMVKKLVKKP